MNKLKYVSIVLNIILIIALLVVITGKKEDTSKNKKYVCTINTELKDGSKVSYINTIYFDENNEIKDYENKTEFDFKTEKEYKSMTFTSEECKDTYKKDKKVVCVGKHNETSDKILGTWAHKYVVDIEATEAKCTLKED